MSHITADGAPHMMSATSIPNLRPPINRKHMLLSTSHSVKYIVCVWGGGGVGVWVFEYTT